MNDPRGETRGRTERDDASAYGDLRASARRADLALRIHGNGTRLDGAGEMRTAHAVTPVSAPTRPAGSRVPCHASRDATDRIGQGPHVAPQPSAARDADAVDGGARDVELGPRAHVSPVHGSAGRTVLATVPDARSEEGGRRSLGVVIPTLDEQRRLPLLLDRLLDPAGQYDPSDRADVVVVADGESRDATREIARERGALVVRTCPSRGVQLATGAHALATDVLLFLHADCLPRRGALARVREAFEDEEVLATAMHQRIESEGLLYRCIERCADLRSRLGLVWGDSGLAVRRDVYTQIGGFGPFEIFEDIDLSLRLRRALRVRFLAEATLAVSPRRWHAEGAWRCTLRNWGLCARFFLGADPQVLARQYKKSPAA